MLLLPLRHPCLYLLLPVFLYCCCQIILNSRLSCNPSRKDTFCCMESDDRSIFHGQLCVKFRMLVSLSHIDFNFLLFGYFRYCIPCSYRTIFIIRSAVCFQKFSVCSYRFDGITDLVLYSEYKCISFFNASRTIYDPCAVFRVDRICNFQSLISSSAFNAFTVVV